jgi:hypothetical protein
MTAPREQPPQLRLILNNLTAFPQACGKLFSQTVYYATESWGDLWQTAEQ